MTKIRVVDAQSPYAGRVGLELDRYTLRNDFHNTRRDMVKVVFLRDERGNLDPRGSVSRDDKWIAFEPQHVVPF